MAQRIEVPGMGVVEFPDGMTDAQIVDAIRANAPKDEPFPVKLGRGVMNAAAGAIRGAGSIGATLLASPRELGQDLMGGPGTSQRRADMTAGLQSMGADPQSLAFQGGKVLTEIGGTLGVGGGAANVLGRVAPTVAARAVPALEALRTGGMSSAGVAGAPGVALRMAGGGVNGAMAAGLVNPEDAAMGAGVGAVLPPALQAAGMAGHTVGSTARGMFAGEQTKGGMEIAKALDLKSPAEIEAVIAQLRAAKTMVPGSTPTAAQALRTPQAGIMQRVVSDSAGGGALRDQLVAQNAARLAALERVAPTNPNGFRSAQQDLGETVGRFALKEDAAARSGTRALYQATPQDEAAFYLPELGGIRDEFFGRGSFTPRAAVDQAVRTAQEIGNEALPAVKAARAGPQTMTLAQAVRKAGGLSIKNNDGLRGEVAGMRGEFKNLVRQNGGLPPDRMAEKMREAGYIGEESADALFEALKSEARGGRSFSAQNNIESGFAAMRDAAMGDAPGAQLVPKKVTLREFDNLRKSIGSSARGAGMDAERATEAAALNKMRDALDDRINEVVRGDGAFDENLPIEWANQLDAARRSKIDQVARFRTGPQASIFRMGSDGQPSVQGGEIAAKFWGSRPGVADDVKSFKRLIGDQPKLLGQFRSMVATEGAGTVTQGGNLTGKFVKWVENTLPGLREAFDPAEVKTLQRIAADIKRAEIAAAAGMSRGSNTYQNAQNALNLGLLDNPLLNYTANHVPLAGPGLNWLKDSAREAKGRRLAGLLSDAGKSADALGTVKSADRAMAGLLASPEIQSLLLRGAPVAVADR
jgi:hypothetical protein